MERGETPVDELLEEHDRFDKAIVLGIVVTTLLAAITGLGQIRALQRHDQSVARADQWAALASQASFTSNSIAQLQLDRFRLVQDANARLQQTTADAFFRVGLSPSDFVSQHSDWQGVAASLQAQSDTLSRETGGFGGGGQLGEIARLSQASMPDVAPHAASVSLSCRGVRSPLDSEAAPGPINASGRDGPQQDPTFPARYLADSRRQAYVFEADGELASEHAQGEEKQFTRFGVSLTVFATAVFLFGFALSPYGKTHRHLYTTGALLFVTGATAWAAYATVSNPPGENPKAAIAYADGRVAGDKGDWADTELAVKLDKCAIALDPNFAPAYTALALEENSLTSPGDPTGESNAELVGANGTLHRAESALHRASALGLKNPSLDENAGSDLFEDGLRTSNRSEMQRGLALEQSAAQLLFDAPSAGALLGANDGPRRAEGQDEKVKAAILLGDSDVIAFNIADAQLALGELQTARRSYATAIALARVQMRLAGKQAQPYVGSALTDLADVYEHSAKLRGAVRQEEQVVIDGLYDNKPTSRAVADPGVPPTLSLTVLPTLVQFTLKYAGSLAGQAINAQWYYRPSASAPWSAFTASPSGPTQLLRVSETTHVGVAAFSPAGLANPVCLHAGEYMLELWVDGHLFAKTAQSISVAQSQPEPVQDLGLTLCRPQGGKQDWRYPIRVLGLAAGYLGSDRGRLLVFDASPEADRAITSARRLDGLLGHVLGQVRSALPSHLKRVGPMPYSFLGKQDDTPVAFVYPGGVLVAGITQDSFGRAIVLVAYGPAAMMLGKRDVATGKPIATPMAESLIGSAAFDG